MTLPEFIQELSRDARSLLKYYSREEIGKSFLTGFLYFFFPASLVIAIGVNLLITFYFVYIWFYVIMFLILFALVYYGTCKVIQTLKNYNDVTIIRYTRIKLIIMIPIYLFLLYIAIATGFEITQ